MAEFNTLLERYTLIARKLQALRVELDVQEQLETLNNISFSFRPSNDIKQRIQIWSEELQNTKLDIGMMIDIVKKDKQ